MIRTKTILAAATLIGLAAPALAMDESRLRAMDKDGDGAISRGEFSEFATFAFDQMDTDNSQTLSADEVDDHLTPDNFNTLDADSDGAVTKEEFGAQMSRDFDAADRDRNGMID